MSLKGTKKTIMKINNNQKENNKKLLNLIDLPIDLRRAISNEIPLSYFQFKQNINFIQSHTRLFFYYPVEYICEGCNNHFYAFIYTLLNIYKQNTYYLCRGCLQLMYHGHLTLSLIHAVRKHKSIPYELYLQIKEKVNCQDLLVEFKCKICHEKKIVACNILNRRKALNFECICNDCIRACSNLKSLTGYYQNIYFESAFELAFLQAALKVGLFIRRCTIHIPYYKDNKKYIYYPDFQINNTIIEIKGNRFLNKETELKREAMEEYCINNNLLYCFITVDMIKKYFKNYLILNQSYFLYHNTEGLKLLSICNIYLNEHSCKIDRNNNVKEPYLAIIYSIENLITNECIFNYIFCNDSPDIEKLLYINIPFINKHDFYKYKIRILSYEKTINYLFINLTFRKYIYLLSMGKFIPLKIIRNNLFDNNIWTRIQRFKYINANNIDWNKMPIDTQEKLFNQLNNDFQYILKIDVYIGLSFDKKEYLETLYPFEIEQKYKINHLYITDYIIHHRPINKIYWLDYIPLIKEIRKYRLLK